MKYDNSTKYALEQESVQLAFEEAKKTKTKASQMFLGDMINRERAKYYKEKGYSNAKIAEEIGVSESFARSVLVTK